MGQETVLALKLTEFVKENQSKWGNSSPTRPTPLWKVVYAYLKRHPQTASALIAHDLNISQDHINRALQILRQKGLAESVRYWQIKDEDNLPSCDKKNK